MNTVLSIVYPQVPKYLAVKMRSSNGPIGKIKTVSK